MLITLEFGFAPVLGLVFGLVGFGNLVAAIEDTFEEYIGPEGAFNTVLVLVFGPLIGSSLVWPFLHEHGSSFAAALWMLAALLYSLSLFAASYAAGRWVRKSLWDKSATTARPR